MTFLLIAALSLETLAGPSPLTPRYEGNCQAPQWAPDGSKIAYEVNFHDRKAIELYLITSTGEVEAVRPSSRRRSDLSAGFSSSNQGGVAHELSWSPSALNSYVYSSSNAARDYNLYLKGGTLVVDSAGTDGSPSWSPLGHFIAFTSARTGQGDLYTLNVQDLRAEPRQLTNDPDASELYAAWSPNGVSIAYVGHSNTGDNLYLIEDTRNPQSRRLTSWQHMQTRPRFSPDGKTIAFYSNHLDSERFDLWVIDVDGSARKLKEDVVMNSRGPVWTADGQAILVVADEDDRFDPLYSVSLAGQERRLDTGTVGNGDFDVATLGDGREYLAIAAQGTPDGDQRDFKQIYVIPLPR